jgi:hypothetical protein
MPLVLKGVEGFVLDLPVCAGSPHQRHEVAVVDGGIGHPREAGHGAVGGVLPLLEAIALEVEVGVVRRSAVDVAETVTNPLAPAHSALWVSDVAATRLNKSARSLRLAPRMNRSSQAGLRGSKILQSVRRSLLLRVLQR